MVSSTAVVMVALCATMEYAMAEDAVGKTMSKAFAVSPLAPSVSKAAPLVADSFQEPKALFRHQGQTIVMQMQDARTKSSLRGQEQPTREQAVDGVLMGSIAFVGLVISMGIAAFKKFASNGRPTSESESSAGISMLQHAATVQPAQVAQVAAGVAAAALVSAQPAQPAFAVAADMDPVTGMARMPQEYGMVNEDAQQTFERRIREDQLLVLPGVGIVFVIGSLYNDWASYQDDDVDFFDGYESRRVDRAGDRRVDKFDDTQQAILAAQQEQIKEVNRENFYTRFFGGGSEYEDLVEQPKPKSRSSRAKMSAASRSRSCPAKMSAEKPIARRDLISKTLGASALFAATAANAEIDYAGVGYLGGAAQIDVNNANVRVYTKKPGMYPSAAGKIVSNAPYKDKADMYAKAKFTQEEAEIVKKYDSQFIFLEPRAEYIIDNINNGLYR